MGGWLDAYDDVLLKSTADIRALVVPGSDGGRLALFEYGSAFYDCLVSFEDEPSFERGVDRRMLMASKLASSLFDENCTSWVRMFDSGIEAHIFTKSDQSGMFAVYFSIRLYLGQFSIDVQCFNSVDKLLLAPAYAARISELYNTLERVRSKECAFLADCLSVESGATKIRSVPVIGLCIDLAFFYDYLHGKCASVDNFTYDDESDLCQPALTSAEALYSDFIFRELPDPSADRGFGKSNPLDQYVAKAVVSIGSGDNRRVLDIHLVRVTVRVYDLEEGYFYYIGARVRD
jgi:hypothetical protein